MGIVRATGVIRAGDEITLSLPEGPHLKLECV
jgi:MOSC domain-containing protein YiiM